MSNILYSVVECDKDNCAHEYRGQEDMKTRDVRALAKKEGWKLGKSKDFCPSCSAEISETIKLAQEGKI